MNESFFPLECGEGTMYSWSPPLSFSVLECGQASTFFL